MGGPERVAFNRVREQTCTGTSDLCNVMRPDSNFSNDNKSLRMSTVVVMESATSLSVSRRSTSSDRVLIVKSA
jgi:hypothetical protein